MLNATKNILICSKQEVLKRDLLLCSSFRQETTKERPVLLQRCGFLSKTLTRLEHCELLPRQTLILPLQAAHFKCPPDRFGGTCVDTIRNIDRCNMASIVAVQSIRIHSQENNGAAKKKTPLDVVALALTWDVEVRELQGGSHLDWCDLI